MSCRTKKKEMGTAQSMPRLNPIAVRKLAAAPSAVSFMRKLAATTSAPAIPDAGFKQCCLSSGEFDGVLRDYYF